MARLSKTRRKRPVPEDWATPDDIESFDIQEEVTPDASVRRVDVVQPLAINGTGDLAITNGTTGDASVVQVSTGKTQVTLKNSPIRATSALFWKENPILGLADGAVKVFDQTGAVIADIHIHSGPVTALAIHPCGDLLASVGEDKSFVLYDLNTMKAVQRVSTDSGMLGAFPFVILC